MEIPVCVSMVMLAVVCTVADALGACTSMDSVYIIRALSMALWCSAYVHKELSWLMGALCVSIVDVFTCSASRVCTCMCVIGVARKCSELLRNGVNAAQGSLAFGASPHAIKAFRQFPPRSVTTTGRKAVCETLLFVVRAPW